MECNTQSPIAIGERILKLRQKRGFTQKELADKLFVKRETITQWENGTRQIKGSDIASLADVLETTCDYILRGISSDNVQIARVIGLNQDSIENLRKLCEDREGIPHYDSEINDLIGSPYFVTFFGRWYFYKVSVKWAARKKHAFCAALEKHGKVPDKKRLTTDELVKLAAEYCQKPVPEQEDLALSEIKEHAADFWNETEKKNYNRYGLIRCVDMWATDYEANCKG